MIPETFTHTEDELATLLGVPRKKIAALRSRLTRGAHWTHSAGAVRYSEHGRARLLELLGAADAGPAPIVAPPEFPSAPTPPADSAPNVPAPAPTAEKISPEATAALAAPQPGAIEELSFVKAFTFNKRVMQARRGEELVRVRVSNPDHFTKGMAFKASHVGADLWELEGRTPRWKGKW